MNELLDCGQDGVCARPGGHGGCVRHWEERNRELGAEVLQLRARVNDEHNALALVDKLHADLAEVTRERDEARARVANYEKNGLGVVPVDGGRCVEVYQDGEMVELETSEAGDEVIALRKRVAELESHELEVSRLTGIVHETDYHCHAGPRDQVLGEIERLKSEARDTYELRQRVAELEAELEDLEDPCNWAARLSENEAAEQNELCRLRARVAELEAPPVVPEGCVVERLEDGRWWASRLGWLLTAGEQAAAYRALAWAMVHDARPPHAGDE